VVPGEGERRDAEVVSDVDGERHVAISDNTCHRCIGDRKKQQDQGTYTALPVSHMDSMSYKKLRGWSSGSPSGRESKRRTGGGTWPRRRRLCSVWRKVTWTPASTRAVAKWSMGLMCPCRGQGNTRTCTSV
uniref:Uncharacterized protein n=1 Tax=Triticum urartu TaxID=4572 RepID=A0A8R7V7S8_TRIUA